MFTNLRNYVDAVSTDTNVCSTFKLRGCEQPTKFRVSLSADVLTLTCNRFVTALSTCVSKRLPSAYDREHCSSQEYVFSCRTRTPWFQGVVLLVLRSLFFFYAYLHILGWDLVLIWTVSCTVNWVCWMKISFLHSLVTWRYMKKQDCSSS